MLATSPSLSSDRELRLVGRIPVRNIWLLFLYAAHLARFHGQHAAAVEESPDFPTLIARLLSHAVERRLRRNLSRGYRREAAVLSRVRGRIDVLETFAGDLLRRGAVACRFDELTFDTTRNRLVRAALDAVAARVADPLVAHDCRRLAGDLGRLGVRPLRPSRSAFSADRIGRHDAEDALMVSLARIVFDLVLPTEDSGGNALTRVEKDEILVRHLFERAVGNFYAAELPRSGWTVSQARRLHWPVEAHTAGVVGILPVMTADIVLDHPAQGRRIVVDTKFANILTSSRHREAILNSGHIYQLYSYIRSQEQDSDARSVSASGMLLHPTVGCDVDETVRVQGHDLRFATVDLSASTEAITSRLRSLASDWHRWGIDRRAE